MPKKASHIHRPRMQTPEQAAAEKSIRERFQKERPSLQTLVDSGDIQQVFSMGEYWELLKTFAALKALREQRGWSISDLANRTGIEQALIARLESGQIDNLTIGTMTRYANALGKHVRVKLVDAEIS